MKLGLTLLLPFLVFGCTATRSVAPSESGQPAAAAAAPAVELTLGSFEFIGLTTTIPDVIHTLGPPDHETGGALKVYVYRLIDNSEVWIGTTSPARILYVRHGAKFLFQR